MALNWAHQKGVLIRKGSVKEKKPTNPQTLRFWEKNQKGSRGRGKRLWAHKPKKKRRICQAVAGVEQEFVTHFPGGGGE